MLEFNTSSDPVSRNLLAEPLVVSNGRVALPTGPGLGIEVDMEAINRLAGVHLD
jgi:L-alanine-DL-glutamate epimerase-like enolase superfamily enzyme